MDISISYNTANSQRVPLVKARHMAMTPICLIFWSLIDKVEELLFANFQGISTSEFKKMNQKTPLIIITIIALQ